MAKTTRFRRRVFIGAAAVLVLSAAAFFAVRAGRGSGDKLREEHLPVPIGAVEIGDVRVRLDEVGTIEPVVKVDVKSTISGRVVELLVREGDAVRPGDVLARVEPDVNQAQEFADVRSREKQRAISLEDAKRERENQERLYREGYTSRDSWQRAEAAFRRAEEEAKSAHDQVAIAEESGVPLRQVVSVRQRVVVSSPMAGTVIARPVEIGETITSGVSSFNAGTVLFTIADLGAMKFRADVNEVEIGKLRTGQPVGIRVEAFPFRNYEGTVSFLSPAARTVERVKVFEVEVEPSEQSPEFRPGMTASLSIRGEERTGVLTIPAEALFRRDEKDVVFVLRPDFAAHAPADFEPPARGKADVSAFWKELFEMRPVKVGLAGADRVEVLEGLAAGDRVALDDPAKPPAEED